MITVIGSYGVSMTMWGATYPVEGETVMGHNFMMQHGGKGANQAVGCARMGQDVFFYTCLGKDRIGKDGLAMLKAEGIDVSQVKYSDYNSTDVGLIVVDEQSGNNRIIVQYSACQEIEPKDIEKLRIQIEKSDLVVTQFEMKVETVVYLSKLCKEVDTPLLLNPAPYCKAPEELFKNGCDYLTPNESEARQMLDMKPDDPSSDEKIAEKLIEKGIKNVVMTRGEKGVLVANEHGIIVIPGMKVKAVSTVGAGDTFTAAFAVAISERMNLKDAVSFANAAAALSVTHQGQIEAIPFRKEVEEFLAESERA